MNEDIYKIQNVVTCDPFAQPNQQKIYVLEEYTLSDGQSSIDLTASLVMILGGLCISSL